MKKSVLAATISAALVLTTGAALANPITLDGSVSFQNRHNTGSEMNGNKTTFLLNANMQLSDSYTFFARGAIQGTSSLDGGLPDYQTSVYNNDKYASAIDQFGIKYKQGNVDATIGRQANFIGATGLLYDNTGYLGKRFMNDGVTLNIANGDTTYNFVVVQEDRDKNASAKKVGDNKIYALHVDNKATDALTIGATLAKYDYQTNNASDADLKKDPTYWAINANYALGKANLYTEYAKSSMDVNNKAYAYGVSYAADDKNSVSVTSYKVQDNGDIGAMTTFDNGYKGLYYGYNHTFDKATSLNLFYKDSKSLADNSKTTSFRTTITYKF